MLVRQVPVFRVPIFEQLYTILDAHQAEKPEKMGSEVWTDISNPPSLGAVDGRCYPLNWYGLRVESCRQMAKALLPVTGLTRVRESWYLPKNGGIGWHTNHDNPGWRAYIVLATGESFMGVRGMRVTDRDAHANVFQITGKGEDSWHCVGAFDERWSLGVSITDELAESLVG